MEEQVCVIYAGVNGYCDPMPLERVKPFEEALLLDLRGQNVAILNEIRDSKDLSDATAAKLKAVVEQVAKQFA
jgi:F-type H+-transporting ATPase subunit alpha